jgi:hypothetical protein
MPMTAPVTFPSDEVDSYRANLDARGWRAKPAERVAAEVALGSCKRIMISHYREQHDIEDKSQPLTALENRAANMLTVSGVENEKDQIKTASARRKE